MTKEKGRGKALLTALAVNAAAFALGSLCGFLLVGWFFRLGTLSFERWMEGYALGVSLHGLDGISFWAVLWDSLRWPLFVWLLGCTALGVWMVPVMFALRGFFLCFSVAGLAGAAKGGFLLALILLGLGSLVSLCAFFLLGLYAWDLAREQRGRLLGLPLDRGYCLRGGLVLLALAPCALAKSWLLPALLRAMLPILTP